MQSILVFYLKQCKYMGADLLLVLLWMLTVLFFPTSSFSLLFYKPRVVLLHVSKLTMVVCCGGTMKSEEFLLSQTLPSCFNHPSSPEQPRSGNPGRSVVLSTNTQPPPSSPYSPLLLSYLPFLIVLHKRLFRAVLSVTRSSGILGLFMSPSLYLLSWSFTFNTFYSPTLNN